MIQSSSTPSTTSAAYRVYAGPRTQPTTLLTTQPKEGYETETVLRDLPNAQTYFRVMPVDNLGSDMVYTNEVYAARLYLPIHIK